jgi:Flp pilus assembly protein TadG
MRNNPKNSIEKESHVFAHPGIEMEKVHLRFGWLKRQGRVQLLVRQSKTSHPFGLKFRSCINSQKGSNLLEAAAILPLLLLLTFAVIDFGSLFYVYLALENGVSQATRYAVTGQTMNDPNNPGQKLPRDQSIKIAMRQATPTITINDSEFAFYNVTKGISGTGGPNDVIKVSVNHNHRLMTPFIGPFFSSGQFTFTVSSTMKNEPYA